MSKPLTAMLILIGHSRIKECEIEIGGQRIDKHTAMWNRVYSDLTEFNPDGHFGGEITLDTTGDQITLLDGSGAPAGNSTGTLYQLMTGNMPGLNTDGVSGDNELGKGANGTSIVVNGFTFVIGETSGAKKASISTSKIFIPLNFWFCREVGLSLPLIALQYHEVKINLQFEDYANLIRTCDNAAFGAAGTGVIKGDSTKVAVTKSFKLWGDYIYLDTDERRRFAQASHEYLIDQLQISNFGISTLNSKHELQINHPVKELIWVIRNETSQSSLTRGGRNQVLDTDKGDWTASPVSVDDFRGDFLLRLNGHDRFAERDSLYFTRTQIWQHHTGYGSVPGIINGPTANLSGDSPEIQLSRGIGVYSFALKPEDQQPSGTCNFSRIDNVSFDVSNLKIYAMGSGGLGETQGGDDSIVNTGITNQTTNLKLTVFAVNYNILRIMSGMGGLAYSN